MTKWKTFVLFGTISQAGQHSVRNVIPSVARDLYRTYNSYSLDDHPPSSLIGGTCQKPTTSTSCPTIRKRYTSESQATWRSGLTNIRPEQSRDSPRSIGFIV